MYVCMYVCMYGCIYVHTHTFKNWEWQSVGIYLSFSLHGLHHLRFSWETVPQLTWGMMTLQEMDALLGEIGEQLACRSWASCSSCSGLGHFRFYYGLTHKRNRVMVIDWTSKKYADMGWFNTVVRSKRLGVYDLYNMIMQDLTSKHGGCIH